MNEQLENQTKALLKAFECGIDYGLLIAEEERDNEDVFDAFLCAQVARKMCVPSVPARRRQPRSENWRKAKRESYSQFIDLIVNLNKEEAESALKK